MSDDRDDPLWCYENPLEASEKIASLRAALAEAERHRDEWHVGHDCLLTLSKEEIAGLRARVAELEELLRGFGANRYWEGRWRDADAGAALLRARIAELEAERDAAEQESDFLRSAYNDLRALNATVTFAAHASVVKAETRCKSMQEALEEIASDPTGISICQAEIARAALAQSAIDVDPEIVAAATPPSDEPEGGPSPPSSE